MAYHKQGLRFVCRSCQNSISKVSSPVSKRYLSASAPASKSVPTFSETPSQDVNDILFEFRDKVFIPSVLSKTHQKLIYKKSRHQILRNDPGVTVTLDNDEEIKLEPRDRWNRPNKHKSLYKLARILGEDGNATLWENLPRFLEGMNTAKEVIPRDFLEKITRKANETGRAGIIRQCAEMVKRTGVKLSMREVTRELFLGIHTKAAEAGFKGIELQEALKEAKMLVSLMEKEEHCASKLQPNETDMRRDPVVISTLLELEAATAIETHGSKDTDGKVTAAAQRLLSLSNNSIDLLTKDNETYAPHAVENWIPTAKAVRMTLNVAGLKGGQKDAELKMKMELKKLLDHVDQAISEKVIIIKEEAKGKPRRALKMLNDIQ